VTGLYPVIDHVTENPHTRTRLTTWREGETTIINREQKKQRFEGNRPDAPDRGMERVERNYLERNYLRKTNCVWEIPAMPLNSCHSIHATQFMPPNS